MLRGQVIYRDFYYASPPLTVYKEAAVAALLGPDYGFLASRWVFTVEVSLGSVLAYLAIRRFFTPTVAFAAALPTVFFTTVLYAYSNFNFDAQVLFLAGFVLVVWAGERERWPLILAAGVLCGMAFLAKPTYLAMVVGISGLGLLRPLTGGPRRWPVYALGFVLVVGLVFAAIAASGMWDAFRHQSFAQLLQARPVSRRQLIYQDWPRYLLPPGRAAIPPLAAAALVAATLWRRWLAGPALVVLAVVLGALMAPAVPTSTAGIPTPGQLDALVGALALVLGVNGLASLLTVAARMPGLAARPWAARVRSELYPPMVPIVAAVLEYLHGIDLSSMRFAYAGTFLGVPVALTFIYALCRMAGAARLVSALTPAVLGAFIAAAGAVVTHGSPYLDGPRADMTATFGVPRLGGIATVPANADHVSALVREIDSRASATDAVLVFPDGQAYYVITGRSNPTKVDWYDLLATTPAMADEASAALQNHPPRWIFVQRYNESDLQRSAPLDFEAQAAWKPVFDYIQNAYDLVGSVDGVDIYRLK